MRHKVWGPLPFPSEIFYTFLHFIFLAPVSRDFSDGFLHFFLHHIFKLVGRLGSGSRNDVRDGSVARNSSDDFLPDLSENRSERASVVWPFFVR
jgi:hypothetical protein